MRNSVMFYDRVFDQNFGRIKSFTTKELSYFRINQAALENFTSFIYHVYAKEYRKKYNWNPKANCYDEMIAEDKLYFPYAHYYVCYHRDAGIIGACRITKRTAETVFPIESDFHVQLDYLVKGGFLDFNEVWHFGRLAIDKEKIKAYNLQVSSMEILSKLLYMSLRVVCKKKNNLLISEIDYGVFRLMNQLGINMEIVGRSKNYLGSNTFPAIVTADDLRKWLRKQKDNCKELKC